MNFSSYLPWIIGIGVIGALYLLALYVVALVSVKPIRIPFFLSPGALGLPQESTRFKTEDGLELRGWWMHRESPHSVAVLCHGYMMNRSEPIPLAKRLWEEGCACLIFDFRAHGNSEGKLTTIGPSERHDVRAAIQEARRIYPDAHLWVWGSSMGGAAAAFALARDPMGVKALVLDSTYADLYRTNDGWWHNFVGPRFKAAVKPVWVFCWALTRFDPRRVRVNEALESLHMPVFLVYGRKDMIVPPAEAEKNVASARFGEVVWFETAGHSQARWFETKKYDAALFEFLGRHGLLGSDFSGGPFDRADE